MSAGQPAPAESLELRNFGAVRYLGTKQIAVQEFPSHRESMALRVECVEDDSPSIQHASIQRA